MFNCTQTLDVYSINYNFNSLTTTSETDLNESKFKEISAKYLFVLFPITFFSNTIVYTEKSIKTFCSSVGLPETWGGNRVKEVQRHL